MVPKPIDEDKSTMNLSLDPLPPIQGSAQEAQELYKPALAPHNVGEDNLSPADAVQHMRDVSRLLRTWRGGLERAD
jgi:hypothetical protein